MTNSLVLLSNSAHYTLSNLNSDQKTIILLRSGYIYFVANSMTVVIIWLENKQWREKMENIKKLDELTKESVKRTNRKLNLKTIDKIVL